MADLDVTFDLISRLDLRSLTFMLHQFLPTSKLAEVNQDLQRLLRDSKLAQTINLPKTDRVVTFLYSGSTVEGLSVPLVIRKNNVKIEEVIESDLDLMLEISTIISNENSVVCISEVVMEPDEEFPGYVRLLVAGTEPSQYLNSAKQIEPYHEYLSENDANKGRKVTRVITGPAIKSNIDKNPEDKVTAKRYLEVEFDLVMAFPVTEWPSFADEWLGRVRHFDWPSHQTKSEITSGGCHIVCTGHSKSKNPEYLFRFSFSLAEKALAHSLNPTQKQAYVLLKILQVQAFREPKVVSTYFLKNVLLWACEETDPSFWTPKNLAKCLFYLLDRLIFCLSKRNLPHYFLRGNNLLRYIPNDLIREVCCKVIAVRQDPLNQIFRFNKKSKFTWGPYYTDIRTCLQPVLQWMHISQPPTSHDLDVAEWECRELLAHAYLEETLEVEKSVDQITEKELKEICVRRYNTTVEILTENCRSKNKVLRGKVPVERSLLRFVDDLNNLAVKTRFLIYLLERYKTSEYLAHMYSLLGGVYHRAAQKATDKEEIKEMTTEANHSYRSAIQCSHCTGAIFVEYGHFLCHSHQYNRAEAILSEAIKKLSENDGRHEFHTYERKHIETVHDVIAYVIKYRGRFVVTSAVLAHYLMMRCHHVLGNHNTVKHDLYHFRRLCATTADSVELPAPLKANAYYLISSCYYQVKRWDVCLKNIDRALQQVPGHVGAVWIKTWCLKAMESQDT